MGLCIRLDIQETDLASMKKILPGLVRAIAVIAPAVCVPFVLLPAEAAANTLLQRSCRLDANDDTLTDESLFDRHSFAGAAGQSVTVFLNSRDFDPYLLVMTADNETIAENDDINENDVNSRLTVTLPKNGMYSVLANSYNHVGLGDYTLTVTSPIRTPQPLSDIPDDCR